MCVEFILFHSTAWCQLNISIEIPTKWNAWEYSQVTARIHGLKPVVLRLFSV
ncbi:hypothetical protein SAMN05421752_1411 [Natronorubrum thiooxidans]|uniref:Uncharacterized protein n=1 Tax=Natronorubrum thiooxidans TaxID=308853 RepID=A0A1N7HAN3_9EURY|nr:hypothetical protein SAMN05421752_1411 [Natronorubrum thiooxidans]